MIDMQKWRQDRGESQAERKDFKEMSRENKNYESGLGAWFFLWISLSPQKSTEASLQSFVRIRKLKCSPQLCSSWSRMVTSTTCTSEKHWDKVESKEEIFWI